MTWKLHNWGRVINELGVYSSEAQAGCLWRSVTPFRSASAAGYILSVSHQQISLACLPNTVTAAETESIALACLKCKWTPLRTTENRRGGVIYQLVCGRKVSSKTQRTQNIRREQKQTLCGRQKRPWGSQYTFPTASICVIIFHELVLTI